MKKRPLGMLVPLYRTAVAWKNARFDRGVHVKRLRQPVLSVGSLSAGGAGKTPVVAALAELLVANGYSVDILTRGYKRSGKTVKRVDPEGDARKFGDEPLMLARATGVPVFAAAQRVEAGDMAEATLSIESRHLHLLDDGFQHRQLFRNLDVVLLTLEDVSDRLLPAGNLREPLQSLQRASVIVVRDEERSALREWTSGRAVWTIKRVVTMDAAPKKPLVFCGLARPQDFIASLKAIGVVAKDTVLFQDHHRYRKEDMARLVRKARRAGADGFVVTEKDYVKLRPKLLARLEAVGPVRVAKLHVEFGDPNAVLRAVEEMKK